MRASKYSVRITTICIGMLIGLTLAEFGLRWATDPVHLPLDLETSTLLRYRLDWHHDRPPGRSSFDIARTSVPCTEPLRKIYIGGDSWVQSEVVFRSFVKAAGDALARNTSGGCAQIINTGTGSFSPTTITAKLIAAMKEYGPPDLVLIHIDETDVMDEWVRYRPSRIEGSDGRTLAVVPFLPDLPEMVYYSALAALSDRAFYVQRFAEYLYVRYVLVPGVRSSIAQLGMLPNYESIMAIHREGLADGRYTSAVEWFKVRLREMIDLIRRLKDDVPIVISTHPHFLHLHGDNISGYRFTVATILSDILRRSAAPRVYFLNAADDMKGIYGPDVAGIFRWPSDPFSHLTPQAEERFGTWLAFESLRYLEAP